MIQNQRKLKHAQKLVLYLLDHPLNEEKRPKGFKGRFGKLFHDKQLLLATATHPKFKIKTVARINRELESEIKSILLEEILEVVPKENIMLNNSDDKEEDDFFKV